MEGLKLWLMAITCVVLSFGGVVGSQKKLRTLQPQERFQEMMYLPSGKAAQYIALGFNAPVADSIWLKTLIYFTSNLDAKFRGNPAAKHLYTFKAFDVITDLSPRFRTAYEQGGLLISAVGKGKEARYIFEKGLKVYPKDYNLHLHLATVARQQLNDRALMKKHMQLAANCPDVPGPVMGALIGVLMDENGPPDPVKMLSLQVASCEEILKSKETSNQLRKYTEFRLALARTQRLILQLNKHFFSSRIGSVPSFSLTGFIKQSDLPIDVQQEMQSFPFLADDEILFSHQAGMRSIELAKRDWKQVKIRLEQQLRKYQRQTGKTAQRLEALLDEGLIQTLPKHPLAPWGVAIRFDVDSQTIEEVVPTQSLDPSANR